MAEAQSLPARSDFRGYAIFREGGDVLVGDGSTVLAWVDSGAGRAVAVPDDLRALLTEEPVNR